MTRFFPIRFANSPCPKQLLILWAPVWLTSSTDFTKQSFHLFDILLSRLNLNPTANVHCIRFYIANGFINVFRGQPPGENHTSIALGSDGNVPLKGLSCTS